MYLEKPIIVIGKDGCEACKKAKDFFSQHTSNFIYVQFNQLNIEYRRYLTEQFRSDKDAVTFPILLVPSDNDYIVVFGFSEQMFRISE